VSICKNESSDDEEDHNIKKGRKHHQHKKNHKQDKHEKKKNSYKKKKSLYSKGVSDSSEESDESIFIVIEKKLSLWPSETKIDVLNNEDKGKEKMDSEKEENVETDGEVDLEEELICALRKIKKLKKNNLKQKE
jgi:hypothetical protein